ncbi:carbohydrate ABC transporter permease [Anaerocolumna sp. MB42-C2]|uniref:carbohydrate ABC transporter permease n=1 Tax=Anaerocolumna sp. MB42-C2 TaxID=3070997 RepID=UPI0027DF9CFD|nr:sugar ABC transporter permease [Anaerocolumna sp. MB42-C2]WMJ87461.1 sugar ABC transporter permease [Anaerocolumna sp. MB42-C2]
MSKLTAKKMKKSEVRDNINGFLFALPWIIGFICFSLIPLLTSLYYSFTDFNPVKAPVWVGLENFKYLFRDPLIFKSLKNTLFMAFVSTPINLFIAMLLASVLNSKFKGRGVARTIFFMPSIIPMVAATMVWIWMFDPTYGYINRVLDLIGISGPSWLLNPAYTKWALVLMGTWCTGTTMLICLAALQNVPRSYYESAEIDGANSINKFFKITLPCVAPVLVYQAILNIINSFQYFTQVYVIINASSGGGASTAGGGPANSILMYPLYLFNNAFSYMKMGRASAMAWFLFVIVCVLTLIMTKITKKVSNNGMGGE